MKPLLESKVAGSSSLHRLLQVLGFSLHGVLLAFSYWRLRWEGIEHVPEGPAILAPNHASVVDGTMVSVPVFLHQRCRLVQYVAARDQLEGPFETYLRFFSVIPIDPVRPDWQAFERIRESLEARRLIGIFPEGGVSRDGGMRTFHPVAAWIAMRSRVPLVPVTINGSFDVWPRSEDFPRPGRMQVVYHPPIPCQEMEGGWKDRDQVEEVRKRLEAAVRSRYVVPPGAPPLATPSIDTGPPTMKARNSHEREAGD